MTSSIGVLPCTRRSPTGRIRPAVEASVHVGIDLGERPGESRSCQGAHPFRLRHVDDLKPFPKRRAELVRHVVRGIRRALEVHNLALRGLSAAGILPQACRCPWSRSSALSCPPTGRSSGRCRRCAPRRPALRCFPERCTRESRSRSCRLREARSPDSSGHGWGRSLTKDRRQSDDSITTCGTRSRPDSRRDRVGQLLADAHRSRSW